MEDTIYDLGLFQEKMLFNNQAVTKIIERVPGGWLMWYTNPVTTTYTFIPFDNEFQCVEDNIYPYKKVS